MPSPRFGRRDLAHAPTRVVEAVTLAVELDPYFSLKAAAQYAGVSRPSLRRWLLLPAEEALPCYRLPGAHIILVRRSELDRWLARYRAVGAADMNAIVDELLGGSPGRRRRGG
jgi:hypothetical protein